MQLLLAQNRTECWLLHLVTQLLGLPQERRTISVRFRSLTHSFFQRSLSHRSVPLRDALHQSLCLPTMEVVTWCNESEHSS